MARWHQLLLALVFLTRLPLGRGLPPQLLRLSDSAWAFPLAGALIGALSALPLLLPGPPLLLATLSVALSVWLTGALHEDALADFTDAMGGETRADRLRIMRNSTIGSYGAMALVLTTALRIAALSILGPWQLVAAAAGGRAAIVLVMGALLPVRADGLGRAAGEPGARNVLTATLIALIFLSFSGQHRLMALAGGMIATAFVIRQARVWLGGQSGDVLGTASILTETAMLVAFAIFASVPVQGA